MEHIKGSGPERSFRVDDLTHQDGVVSGSMPIGTWLRGPAGRPTAGSIGVLVDAALGHAIIRHSDPPRWSVATELTLHVFAPTPEKGCLEVRAWTESVTNTGGFAQGEVRDDQGRLLAVCSQRGRFVPGGYAPPRTVPTAPPMESPDVMTLLGVTIQDDGLRVDVGAGLENEMRNVHGGISLCIAELAALSALSENGPPLVTGSVQIAFVRPIPTGSALRVASRVRHRGRTLAVVDVTGVVDGRTCTVARVASHAG